MTAPPAAPAGGDRTAFDLLAAFAAPGCPVCSVTAAAVMRYLETISYEAVSDPGVRIRLRDSLAYCAVHGQQWIAVQNTLGTAIIYRDACDQAAKILAAHAGGGGVRSRWGSLRRGFGGQGPGAALAAALTPVAPCPACRHSLAIEAGAVASCAGQLGDTAFFAAYARHALGLCLPHFRGVLRQLGDPALVERVAAAQARRLTGTVADLTEVIRKYDYRFVREPHGVEFEAPARSVELIGGRLPTLLNPPPGGTPT